MLLPTAPTGGKPLNSGHGQPQAQVTKNFSQRSEGWITFRRKRFGEVLASEGRFPSELSEVPGAKTSQSSCNNYLRPTILERSKPLVERHTTVLQLKPPDC